ncbi:MAG: hypothetical protein IJN50_07660 [Clostridia bacterium]|nr:hypothetical protein [Clostridia bacterium]
MNNYKKEKKTFTQKKDCAISSIKNVEYFLRNLNKAFKGINIYKLFK